MADDIKLLSSITETADMGRDSLKHVIEKAEDPHFRNVLEKQYFQYDSACKSAEQLLASMGGKPKTPSPVLKTYSHLIANIKAQTAKDSTSKIAEMVIQGSTMGVTEMQKQLNDYEGNNEKVRSLAEDHIKAEHSSIEEMKKFL